MEELFADQIALVDQMHILKRSYSKTSIDRRTVGYVTGKVTTLYGFWCTFHLNYIEIRKQENYNKTEYAISQVYEKCVEEFSLVTGNFKDRLIQLEQANIQNINPRNQNTNPIPNLIPYQNQVKSISFSFTTNHHPYIFKGLCLLNSIGDMFVSLIQSNINLSVVHKLNYLQSNLRDKAADFLRHTPITAENYTLSSNANKRILVDTQSK